MVLEVDVSFLSFLGGRCHLFSGGECFVNSFLWWEGGLLDVMYILRTYSCVLCIVCWVDCFEGESCHNGVNFL